MQLRISRQLRLLRLPLLNYNNNIFFVGCNKDSTIFFSKKRSELEVCYTLLHVCSITGVSSVLFQLFFFTSLMKESMITVRWQYYINFAHALFLAAEVTHVFFPSTLFHAHTFLILILQTACYTHACSLTLISGGCGVLRSTRVLHTKLKRPGTKSNRLGPDPADHLKYWPEPVRVPGPPWRPLHPGSKMNSCKMLNEIKFSVAGQLAGFFLVTVSK